MLLAVVSDIHSNLEALTKVLQDIRANKADMIYCLGDSIGYGPDPVAVLDLLEANSVSSVMGNHELALLKPEFRQFFNSIALIGLIETEKQLSKKRLDKLRKLPFSIVEQGCRMVHGLPKDSATTYLCRIDNHELVQIMSELHEQVAFVGHTHLLEIISLNSKGGLKRKGLGKESLILDQSKRWLINIGSVGQPRDHDPSAKYVLFDTITKRLEVRYVAYDIATCQAKIRRLGLCEINAQRLGRPNWD